MEDDHDDPLHEFLRWFGNSFRRCEEAVVSYKRQDPRERMHGDRPDSSALEAHLNLLRHAKKELTSLVLDVMSWASKHLARAENTLHLAMVNLAFLRSCVSCGHVCLLSMESAEAYRWFEHVVKCVTRVRKERRLLLASELCQLDLAALSQYRPVSEHSVDIMEPASDGEQEGIFFCTCLELQSRCMMAAIWTQWSEPKRCTRLVAQCEDLVRDFLKSPRASLLHELLLKGSTGTDTTSSSGQDHQIASIVAESEQQATERRVADSSEKERQERILRDRIEARRQRDRAQRRAESHCDPAVDDKSINSLPEDQHPVELALPEWYATAAAQRAIVTVSAHDVLLGALEDPLLCSKAAGDAATCAAQTCRGENDTAGLCRYSHIALQHRLCSILLAPRHAAVGVDTPSDGSAIESVDSPTEWVGLCLNLAEYYLEDRDLSHAEHCLSACDCLVLLFPEAVDKLEENIAVTSDSPPSLQNAVLRRYLRSLLDGLQLKLLAVTAAAQGANAQQGQQRIGLRLFKNPLLPPDEHANEATPASTGDVSWGGTGERLAFDFDTIRQKDERVASICLPPKEFLLVDNPTATANELASELRVLLTSLDGFLTIDSDCERFLKSLRTQADCAGVLMQSPLLLSDLDARKAQGSSRLKTLKRIQSSGLDEETFRNVLRQADFDCAATYFHLASLEAKSSEAALENYRNATEHFRNFAAAFRREMDRASKAKATEEALSGADFSAYVLGEMRLAECLIKQSTYKGAVEAYERIEAFADKRKRLVASDHNLQSQVTLATEMKLTILQATQTTKPSKK